jgi:hypothetical protein
VDCGEEFDLPSHEGQGIYFVDVFATFICFAFDPVSVEVFEDAVEVFCGLGESIPLFGIVFQ